MMVKCPRCHKGWVRHHDEGEDFDSPCYHCGNTGWISEEQAFADSVGALAEKLAYIIVNERIEARNANPDGEGWAFCAAENMLTEYEYTQMAYLDETAQVEKVLNELAEQHPNIVRALITASFPPKPVQPPVQPKPVQPPVEPPVADHEPIDPDEDIPF